MSPVSAIPTTIMASAPPSPAVNIGPITSPKRPMAAVTQSMVRRRPRSAMNDETGMVSAKNTTASNWISRNSLRP